MLQPGTISAPRLKRGVVLRVFLGNNWLSWASLALRTALPLVAVHLCAPLVHWTLHCPPLAFRSAFFPALQPLVRTLRNVCTLLPRYFAKFSHFAKFCIFKKYFTKNSVFFIFQVQIYQCLLKILCQGLVLTKDFFPFYSL